jgi:hypothetical protein
MERINEAYLERLIDDLQADYNLLFNTIKGIHTSKEKQFVIDRKTEKHTKLISDLMNKALILKTLLGTLPKRK